MFDQDSDALADADLERVQCGHRKPRPRHAERMARCDRTAMRIDAVGRAVW